MAEDKSLTPEQQLLKLIEESNKAGKNPPPAAPGTPEAATAKTKKTSTPSMGWFSGVLSGRMSFFKRKVKKKTSSRKTAISISDVNKLLYVVVAGMLVYVVFDAGASAMNLRRAPNFAPPKDMKLPFNKETVEPLKETSYYLQKVSARDIFKEGKKEEVKKVEKVEESTAETAAAVQNLSLVGISWSSNPDAIIEDRSSQRTFFVKRGQMAGESVKVEAIFKDHVVVSYEDKEYELR